MNDANVKNRSRRARERAGLSLEQASKILGVTTDDLLMIEELDSSYAAIAPRTRMADIYAVNIEWLNGDRELRDYATIEKIRGADKLTFHDRDIIAEFAASLPRKPAKMRAEVGRHGHGHGHVSAGEHGALCYECGKQLTVYDRELALCNECSDVKREEKSAP